MSGAVLPTVAYLKVVKVKLGSCVDRTFATSTNRRACSNELRHCGACCLVARSVSVPDSLPLKAVLLPVAGLTGTTYIDDASAIRAVASTKTLHEVSGVNRLLCHTLLL